ncbi:MAG: ATP-binding protein [Deltaproteobacteria bacterium]
MKKKALFSWSGGKDSALSLEYAKSGGEYEIAALITTVTSDYGRVSMHGLRCDLLDRQVTSLGYPLEKVLISKNADNNEYEAAFKSVLLKYRGLGVETVIYGDIFLQDIREYREKQLGGIGIKCLFPIWKKDTRKLARRFIDSGFKAVAICVDSEALDGSFAGRDYDYDFLSDLPEGVDPCGENGEFHTFVYDGPVFNERIDFSKGDIVFRDSRFYYCDLIPL